MSIYAEYAHGLLSDEEFRQAVRDEEWLDNVRSDRCDDNDDDDDYDEDEDEVEE